MSFDDRYGIKENKSIKEYHKSRRMFVIKKGQLYIADKGVDYSHAEWFKSLGWLNVESDEVMNNITRGSLEHSGLYFYKGYDFFIDEDAERKVFPYLLIRKMIIIYFKMMFLT